MLYLDLVLSQLAFEREGKLILPKPFKYDNVSIIVSDSKSKAQDQVESVYGIEDEVQSDLYLVPTPNPRPKWAQKVIEATMNMTGDSSDMKRTRSQFQKESLVLCQENSILPQRCYKLLERCYMMVRYD